MAAVGYWPRPGGGNQGPYTVTACVREQSGSNALVLARGTLEETGQPLRRITLPQLRACRSDAFPAFPDATELFIFTATATTRAILTCEVADAAGNLVPMSDGTTTTFRTTFTTGPGRTTFVVLYFT